MGKSSASFCFGTGLNIIFGILQFTVQTMPIIIAIIGYIVGGILMLIGIVGFFVGKKQQNVKGLQSDILDRLIQQVKDTGYNFSPDIMEGLSSPDNVYYVSNPGLFEA